MIEPNDHTPTQEEADALEARLDALASSLLKKRNDAIAARAASGIESQWRIARQAIEGVDDATKKGMLDFATGDAWLPGKGKKSRQSRVVVNIIRGKCDTAEGRFTEIMLPTDDRNWGLLNTPVPESSMTDGVIPPPAPPAPPAPPVPPVPGQEAQPQQPQPAVSQAELIKTALEKARSKMEEEIDDQLNEAAFNAECRKVARSAVRFGTGVLKGPSVVKSISRQWIKQGDVYIMQLTESFKPASKSCDIWNIYPDPNCGNDAKRGAYIWERDHILPREIRELAGIPGYNLSQLEKVLEEAPLRNVASIDKGGSLQVKKTEISHGAPYERWEYHGDIDREDMEAMGCSCSSSLGQSIPACVVFINDRPVKAVQNTLDSGELPYDFFQWVQSDDTPWGMGEPLKIIWQQRIITAAWREMMNNAGADSGPTIVMSGNVEPEDEEWDITGNKVWIDVSEEGDVRRSFSQFQITSNQAELQNIIQLAMRFTDLESGTPALAQGERGSAPETLGGMQLLMQGADTTRRNLVKQWDDQITRPHIKRYYDWNMQYNPRDDIKGDYQVDPRGTSVLLVKDQTVQRLMQVMSLRSDPEVNLQVDWGNAIRQLFQALHLDVLKPAEQVEEDRKNVQPQVPVQVQVAQIQAKKEADHAVADAQIEMQKMQVAASEGEKDRQNKVMIAMINEKMAGMDLQSAEAQTLAKIKADLAKESMALNVQKDLSLAGHITDLHKSSQVIQPPTEPVGRAPDGQAFQA